MPAITDRQLRNAVDQGLSCREIARKYGCHASTVQRRMKKLNICRTSQAAHQANLMLKGDIDAVQGLESLYKRTESLLEHLESVWRGEADLNELREYLGKTSLIDGLLATKKELRNQLTLMSNIADKLFNIQQVREFESIVIDEIRKESPELAQKIVKRLVMINKLYNHLDDDEKFASPSRATTMDIN